jgi:hypothetical protein
VGKQLTLRVKDNHMRIFDDNQLIVSYTVPETKGNLVQDKRFLRGPAIRLVGGSGVASQDKAVLGIHRYMCLVTIVKLLAFLGPFGLYITGITGFDIKTARAASLVIILVFGCHFLLFARTAGALNYAGVNDGPGLDLKTASLDLGVDHIKQWLGQTLLMQMISKTANSGVVGNLMIKAESAKVTKGYAVFKIV